MCVCVCVSLPLSHSFDLTSALSAAHHLLVGLMIVFFTQLILKVVWQMIFWDKGTLCVCVLLCVNQIQQLSGWIWSLLTVFNVYQSNYQVLDTSDVDLTVTEQERSLIWFCSRYWIFSFCVCVWYVIGWRFQFNIISDFTCKRLFDEIWRDFFPSFTVCRQMLCLS